jgi:very-short-patch-repair endonuclease
VSSLSETPLPRQRLTQLFEYLKAYGDLRYPPVRDIDRQDRRLWLDALPAHASVILHRDAAKDEEGIEDGDILLTLTRPTLTPCPPPPEAIRDWVKPGWQKWPGTGEVLSSRPAKDGHARLERFADVARRSQVFQDWQDERNAWVESERPAREALALFQEIYEWYGAAEREGEKIELLVADGVLRYPAPDGLFQHPVLLQRLELEFYPERPQPQFVFRKHEHPPELYMEFLRVLPGVNLEQLGRCAHELKEAEFSPLGNGDTTGFLQRLIQGLFPRSGVLVDRARTLVAAGGADSGPSLFSTPELEEMTPTIERRTVIFMRPRRTGPGNVFELVLEDIATRDTFSPALLKILGLLNATGIANPAPAETLVLGNEDDSVLLGKPANREQLEIAKQLGHRDCVLVQGPPGTGKTHTIANLVGHLLAQGKRVLVTAHTPKALRVLRQKVAEALQPLCVSVLHNDKPSQEELQASVRKIHLRLSEDERRLDREVQRLRPERMQILQSIRETRQQLIDARQDEVRDVVCGDRSTPPIEAAQAVKAGRGEHDWIPGPLEAGAPLPISPAEVAALYQTNARVSKADERELGCSRPDLRNLPAPVEFRRVIDEIEALGREDLHWREELWAAGPGPADLAEFDQMLELAGKTIEFFRDSAAWQLDAIQAGRDGPQASQTWEALATLIENAWSEIHECHATVMEHGPVISDERAPHELLPLVDEIIRHAESGGSFGSITKLMHRPWFDFKERVRTGQRPLELGEMAHLRAVRAALRIRQLRADLVGRWERQMVPRGGIAVAELGEHPEQVCKQYVPRIRFALAWHGTAWFLLEHKFGQLGFHWPRFLETTTPEPGEHAELRRIRRAVVDELPPILQSRSAFLRHQRLRATLENWRARQDESREPMAGATHRLRQALKEAAPDDYQSAHDELLRLKNLEADLGTRMELLARVRRVAPAWASAVENRVVRHSKEQPPGDPQAAWDWRQMHEELERRARVSLDELQQRGERLGQQLMETTTQLIEKLTWLNQIRQTSPEQKQALGAYSAMRSKLTKTGKGIRDAELRAAARLEMATAKDAVPVWIMPLAEVAETFDPRKTRFDVVIIDEASQCDPTSLFALYLGNQTIIVGDDEQVTPVAVGVQSQEVANLIKVFLQDVPHKELYDGETSVYELAQIAFGGVIRLTEHFRCAPGIIAFSNSLSYKGEVQPLREASAITLQPHVVSHRVPDGRERDGVNDPEAEVVASLICAAIKQPEYGRNDAGRLTSFGAISLVGDKQALRIDALLRQHLPPLDYRKRQILCGDSAQFQGDERDVMFLSVVDAPPARPPLPIRQEGAKKIFKKRYNVAASRARNQMWVVHSLNHGTDLQVGDYRRRLIEHSLDPHAWERELQERQARTDQRPKVFEGMVARRLTENGYRVVPQYQAGAFTIDLVVIGGGRRLAIECDGEQRHGPDRLQDDIARQAVLERLGWSFIRIRGSLFFRDEDRALTPVFRRLEELGVTPELNTGAAPAPENTHELIERVTRDAEAIRAGWKAEARESTDH